MIWLKLIGTFLARYWDKLLAFVAGWRIAKTGETNRHLKDQIKRERKARDAVSQEQAETDGLSRRDVIDRMRGRSDDFRGM